MMKDNHDLNNSLRYDVGETNLILLFLEIFWKDKWKMQNKWIPFKNTIITVKIRRKTRKKTLEARNANKSEEQNLEKTLKTYQEHFFHALQGTPLLGHL